MIIPLFQQLASNYNPLGQQDRENNQAFSNLLSQKTYLGLPSSSIPKAWLSTLQSYMI